MYVADKKTKGVFMKKLVLIAAMVAMASTMVFAGNSHIPVTRYMSPDGSLPMTYREWQEIMPYAGPVGIGHVGMAGMDGGKVNLVVNASLYPKLISFLNPTTGQFVTDLTNDGWTVSVDTMSMSADPFAPETLRNFLISEYNNGSVGAVFIGDLPIAWFQMMEVFYGSPPSYTEFPIDLFYMDMDGVWQDNYEEQGGNMVSGSDSIYDTHSGDMGTEIFVGRLPAGTCGNDSALIHDYLQRNHNYRTGSLSLSQEALFYNDDDWTYWTTEWAGQLGAVYDSILIVDHPETTTATDWRARLPVSHEWVAVFVHSSPGAHAFKYNSGGSWSWFYSYEIPGINPVANFYNLFACSNARYTESQNCGAMYTFRSEYGLGALGSTKTGSMLEFQYFYNPLSQGKCIGEAFADWFTVMGNAWGDTSRSWFYGMSFIGDACLVVRDTTTAIAEAPVTEHAELSIAVAPNPAINSVTFALRGAKGNTASIGVYGIDGRIVWKEKITGGSISWDCSDVPAGVYFCRVEVGKENLSKKLVIMR
jgi:hypothetical protein